MNYFQADVSKAFFFKYFQVSVLDEINVDSCLKSNFRICNHKVPKFEHTLTLTIALTFEHTHSKRLSKTLETPKKKTENIVHLTNRKIKKFKSSELGPTAELVRNCT